MRMKKALQIEELFNVISQTADINLQIVLRNILE